jgi:predicted nucleic acid-binding Zn ribbon protein
MWENGVYRRCCVCGTRFYCTDGDYVCSLACTEIDQREDDEDEEV